MRVSGNSIQLRSTAALSSLRLVMTSRSRSILVTVCAGRSRSVAADLRRWAWRARLGGELARAGQLGELEHRPRGWSSAAARRRSAPARSRRARRAGPGGAPLAARKPEPPRSASEPCSGGRVNCSDEIVTVSPRSSSKPIADCTSWRSVSISSGGRGAQVSLAVGGRAEDAVDHDRDADPADLARQDHPLAAGLGDLEVLPLAALRRGAGAVARVAAHVAVGQVARHRDARARCRCAFSELSSTSERIATRLSGSIVRSVIVWLSISASTLTSTIALPGPTRASSRRWMFARSVSARSLAPARPPEPGRPCRRARRRARRPSPPPPPASRPATAEETR